MTRRPMSELNRMRLQLAVAEAKDRYAQWRVNAGEDLMADMAEAGITDEMDIMTYITDRAMAYAAKFRSIEEGAMKALEESGLLEKLGIALDEVKVVGLEAVEEDDAAAPTVKAPKTWQ